MRVLGCGLVLWATLSGGLGLGAAAARAGSTRFLYVAIPGAELASWRDADGPPGRRFVDWCSEHAFIVRPEALSDADRQALDGWRVAVAGGVICQDESSDEPELGSPRDWWSWVGPLAQPILLSWDGPIAEGREELFSRLTSSREGWLQEPASLRWEEIGEFLDLTSAENTALRRLRSRTHPLFALRTAFEMDKRRANLALYLVSLASPAAIGFQLDLASAFEGPVRELASELWRSADLPEVLGGSVPTLAEQPLEMRLAAQQRFFARRLEASRGRVYGRVDRILQSLFGEASGSSVLLIDARGSADPFVAVVPAGGRVGGMSPVAWPTIPRSP